MFCIRMSTDFCGHLMDVVEGGEDGVAFIYSHNYWSSSNWLSCCFFTAVIMNIFHVYTLLAIFVLQMGVALAEESDALPWSGKPNTKANRKNSRGGSSTDHSHHSHHTHHTHHTHHSKSSKSTDSPTVRVYCSQKAMFINIMSISTDTPVPLFFSAFPNPRPHIVPHNEPHILR